MNTPIKKLTKLAIVLIYVSIWLGCEDFLDTQPYGTTTFDRLAAKVGGAEALLIAAYSNLDGVSTDSWMGAASNWIFGSITGGDAYKGSDFGDQSTITPIEIHSNLVSSNPYVEGKWSTYYHGIARANDAIRAFKVLATSDKDYANKIAEARFLRGFYHFELYKLFRNVPFIDETLDDVRIGNTENILPKIQADFLFACKHLPYKQDYPGRITKGAALSYFGIAKMWEPGGFSTAKIYFDSVINSALYKLNDEYHQNFNADFRNAETESILQVQQSVGDGGQGYNGNYGDVLNFPWNSGPVGCCGFFQPSQNLVNAFKTDGSGLPMLDDYNLIDVASDEDFASDDPSFVPYQGTLDPRLDWAVGRRGIPYYDWGTHPGRDWIRNSVDYGPYSPKKNTLHKSQQGVYSDKAGWTAGLNVNNLKLLRYADVLLYAAECEIELGDLEKARDYINQVRRRASNKDGFVKSENGNDAANYLINEYPPFPDDTYARKAVRFERRLELAMEGHRFFDLVRWGIAAEEKNKYFEKEKKERYHLETAEFTKGKHEVLPIPLNAIFLSSKDGVPTLQQNNGYD